MDDIDIDVTQLHLRIVNKVHSTLPSRPHNVLSILSLCYTY